MSADSRHRREKHGGLSLLEGDDRNTVHQGAVPCRSAAGPASRLRLAGWTNRLPSDLRRQPARLSGLRGARPACARPYGTLVVASRFLRACVPAYENTASGLLGLRHSDPDLGALKARGEPLHAPVRSLRTELRSDDVGRGRRSDAAGVLSPRVTGDQVSRRASARQTVSHRGPRRRGGRRCAVGVCPANMGEGVAGDALGRSLRPG